MSNPNVVAFSADDEKAKAKKKRRFDTLALAGGYIAAGLSAAVASTAANGIVDVKAFFSLMNDGDPDAGVASVTAETGNSAAAEVPSSTKIANEVNDSMSFNQAYEAARQQVGSGGVFAWHGQVFNTYTAEEWAQLSGDQKEDFFAGVDDSDIDVPQYDHTPEVQAVHVLEDDQSIYESLQLDPDAPHHAVPVSSEPDTVLVEDSTVTPETFNDAPLVVPVMAPLAPGEEALPPNATFVDLDNDHKMDGLAIDVDNDQKHDLIAVNPDDQGHIEQLYLDTDGKEGMDVLVTDSNMDGEPDSVDPLGTPPQDDFDINNPDSNDFDPNADTSNWQ